MSLLENQPEVKPAPGDQNSKINYWEVLNTAAAALQKASHSETAVYQTFREQLIQLGLQGSINWLDETGTQLRIAAIVFSNQMMRILQRFETLAGQSAIGFQHPLELSPVISQVVQNGEACFVPDNSVLLSAIFPDRMQPFFNQFMTAFGHLPGVLAPLMFDGQVKGILYLSHPQIEATDSTAVTALANHLAIAIENARLRQHAQITEQSLQETHIALAASHEILHALVQQTPVGIQVFNTQGICIDVNQAHLDIFGVSHAEKLIGIYNIFDDPLAESVGTQAAFRLALTGETCRLGDITFDFHHALPGFASQMGQRMVNVTIFPVSNAQGDVLSVVGLNVDVTERKLVEETLRRSEENLRLLAENMPGVIYQCVNNDHFDMLFLNNAIEALTGYPKEMFLRGKISFRDLYHPDDSPHIQPQPRQGELSPESGAFQLIYRIRHRSGAWRWVEEFGTGVLSETGELLFLEGSIVDITERKQAELLQSTLYRIATVANANFTLEQLYPAIHAILADLMDVTNFYIALYDAETGLIVLPYFVDEVDTYDSQPFNGEGGLTDYVIQTGQPQLLNRVQIKRLAGAGILRAIGVEPEVWLGAPLRTQAQVFGAMVVQNYRDASAYTEREKQLLFFVSGQVAAAVARRQAEQQLRTMADEIAKQAHLFSEILSTTPDQFAVYDQDGRFIFSSPSLLNALNLPAAELLGKTMEEIAFLPSHLIQQINEDRKTVFRTGILLQGEIQIPSGHNSRDIEYILSPIKDDDGQVTAVVSAARDITQRNKTRAALHQSQKMESLGILAGGVAHDFNNLLVGMMGQTSLALAKLPSDHPVTTHIQKAAKSIDRASVLTHQLLAYSGRGQFTNQPVNLNHLIQDNYHLFNDAIGDHISLQLNLTQRLSLLDGDPGQIQQVLMNLLLNSSEAMGSQHGRITLTTDIRAITTADETYWQTTTTPLTPGHYIFLSVEDNGEGIDAPSLARIFEPFFTTRFTGRGLGLAAVLGIVRGHEGGLRVHSTPGSGTAVELLFPISAITPQPEPATAPEPSATSPGLILVIDDEQVVREAVADILELQGFEVITAVNGTTGITLYQELHHRIDLILLDLSLPDIQGEQVFARLKEINPHTRVIFSSGYSQEDVIQRADNNLVGFLQKPYTFETLVEAVRKHLPQGVVPGTAFPFLTTHFPSVTIPPTTE